MKTSFAYDYPFSKALCSYSMLFKNLHLLIIVLAFIACHSNQPNKVSPNAVISDTQNVWKLHDSALTNVYNNPNLSMDFALSEMDMAVTQNYERGIIRSQIDIGNVLWITGNYPLSIQKYLNALEHCELTNDMLLMARCFGNLANVYQDMENYKESIYYTYKAIKLDSLFNDSLHLLVDYTNLGEVYKESYKKNNILQHLDSAKFFILKGYGLLEFHKDSARLGRILINLGDISASEKNYQSAREYFSQGIHIYTAQKDYHSLNQAFLSIAEIYKPLNTDSARYYANLAYLEAKTGRYSLGILNASTFLYEIFKDKNRDSTLKYLESIKANEDSLFSVNMALKTQELTYKEQNRQAIKQLAEEQNKKIYEDNLQFAAIAAFIPMFFGLCIILGRIKVRRKVIEFMGLLGLLLLFEFVTLLMHHYLAVITDEPIYMLPVLVIIASILVPAHHKMQNWIMKILVKDKTIVSDKTKK